MLNRPTFGGHIRTAMFIVHNSLPDDELMALMATVQGRSSTSAYILLPCDISKKSLSDWMTQWKSAHSFDKSFVLGVESGAAAALALPSNTFSRSFYINPTLGSKYNVATGQEIFFAGTDVDANYWDADKLYYACKKNNASFEYRIVNGNADHKSNLIKSLESIKYNITF